MIGVEQSAQRSPCAGNPERVGICLKASRRLKDCKGTVWDEWHLDIDICKFAFSCTYCSNGVYNDFCTSLTAGSAWHKPFTMFFPTCLGLRCASQWLPKPHTSGSVARRSKWNFATPPGCLGIAKILVFYQGYLMHKTSTNF